MTKPNAAPNAAMKIISERATAMKRRWRRAKCRSRNLMLSRCMLVSPSAVRDPGALGHGSDRLPHVHTAGTMLRSA
jgi:hypothetical protein